MPDWNARRKGVLQTWGNLITSNSCKSRSQFAVHQPSLVVLCTTGSETLLHRSLPMINVTPGPRPSVSTITPDQPEPPPTPELASASNSLCTRPSFFQPRPLHRSSRSHQECKTCRPSPQ